MLNIAAAVFVALAIWWVSTGLILILDGLPRRTYPVSMTGATALLGLALFGVGYVRNDVTPLGAYIGFGCGIAVWGWLEMSFLMGFLTGPRRHACPLHCRGWPHFLHAVQAILYHELAIIGLGVLVFMLSRHGGNHIAAQCVAILWAMRVSAKLNLFLGVRNLSAELLPADLAYLGSFFRKQPMNFLFPVSITGGTLLATHYVAKLLAPGITEFTQTGQALLASMAILGVLEHWMLVLPFPATALWSWGGKPRQVHSA
jgi:putative photosynthetic complex assembly protein 2